jgi:putative peptide zinc metalloprotease protein
MLTLRDSLVSSSSRRLRVRRRPDLVAQRQQYLGRSYWLVKEPVGLRYFRFQDEEYAILQMFDGDTSLDEIKERFEAEFRPQKITLEELQQFLGMLHRSGLIVADVPGQGVQLLERRRERQRRELLGAFTNVLAIRFKGFDPERFLSWLYPKVSWFFSLPMLVFCALLGLAALLLVTVEFEVFRAKLPGFHDFFNLRNALWLAITLGATKVLHEFGHGLSCKHFGGECHEMGVMLLVLTPCLYCNVSDSWMLPSKWHRAAIGAAGMYVEVVLASICTFIWWFTEPGLLHYTCLNVMFVSSVTTILFNINPLLRYDGYYILADLSEIPNLRQKATQILNRKMGEWLLGIEPGEDPFLPQRRQVFFAAYSIASAVYRWVVLASILWFLYQFFKPYGLQSIGATIAVFSLGSLIGMPLYKLIKFFYIPGRIDKVKKPRMYTSLGVLTAVALAVLFVPLPSSVICTLELQPRDAHPVYIDVADGGKLEAVHVRPGQRVEAGTLLAQLSNTTTEIELVRLTGARNQVRVKLDNLRKQRHRDASAGGTVGEVEKALDTIQRQLEQKQADHRRRELVAPTAGVVLPPPNRPSREPPEGQLPAWSGSPFDACNQQAYLDEGQLLCQIGDPTKYEAILVIDQTDIERVRAALNPAKDRFPKVDIKLDQLPSKTFRSQITDIAESELKLSSMRLSSKTGGELLTTTDPTTGAEKPRSTSYQARAPLDDPDGLMRLGLRGSGRVYTPWESLFSRFRRWASHTFNFKL